MSPSTRRWPAEWAPHRATWLSWPHSRETWPGAGLLESVEDAFCEMVRAILPGEAVEINVGSPDHAEHVRRRLAGAGIRDLANVRCHTLPTDDAWIRDHGGIVVFDRDARGRDERVLLDFEYDAWGGKYPPWDRDAAVAAGMSQFAGIRRESIDLVLEGGSIEGDGEGTILTTTSCLLHPNRARSQGG
ncbi:MAG: agmatine deiminase family protein, partial [Myxococcota bacterium]